jgi:hypothetical protein
MFTNQQRANIMGLFNEIYDRLTVPSRAAWLKMLHLLGVEDHPAEVIYAVFVSEIPRYYKSRGALVGILADDTPIYEAAEVADALALSRGYEFDGDGFAVWMFEDAAGRWCGV